MFRGRWVREKNGFKTEFLITEISENSIKMNGIGIGYLSLLEAYEFTDGSPCGVEIKE